MPGEESLTSSDADILRRTASGDRSAFETIVDRHEGAVLRYIAAVADGDRVEDALQETFIAAWRSAGTFRGDGSARGWLLHIARNAVRRQYRRRAGEPAHHVPIDELAARAGWGDASPEDFAAKLEARELVERGFRALTAEEREILVLRDMEEMSGEETAVLLGLTLAAQKSRLHRARLHLMAVLREVS